MKNTGVSKVIHLFIVCIPIMAIAQTWDAILPQDPTVYLNDLCFLPEGLHGWSVGAANAGGQVFSALFRTTDGTTWEYIPFADSVSLIAT